MELTNTLPEASERPLVSTPSQRACHKELQFDARYGWTYDKFFDPAELATSEGRGRFALLPILAASFHLSVAMVTLLEEASCSYTVRGAKYARKAATSARKGLARRGQRLVSPLRPSHASRTAPKQGLRRPRKALRSPALESGQRVALREGSPVAEENVVEGVKDNEKVSGVGRPDIEARTESAEVRSASESGLAGEGTASESVTGERDTSSKAVEVETAFATVEGSGGTIEARGKKEALHALDEEPEVLAERAAVKEEHRGALTDRRPAAEEKGNVREHAREERREGEALGDGLFRDADEERLLPGLGSDVRATSRGGEADGTSLVIETARGPIHLEDEQLRAEVRPEGETEVPSSTRDTERVSLPLRDVSNLGAGNAVEMEAAARGSADVDSTSFERGSSAALIGTAGNEGSRLEEADTRGKAEAEAEGPSQKDEGDEAASHFLRASEDKDSDTSESGSGVTIWRASDDLSKRSEGPLYVVEAKRFRGGYREVWSEGRKMLEDEKRRLQSQLGKRMSGSKALHRFLREEFGVTTEMSTNC